MKGIVYDTATGEVKYKFDTPGLPTLQANEAIKQRPDIDNIAVGAVYTSGNDTYVNPEIVPPPDWKALYAAAATDAQRIDILAQNAGLK